MRKVVQYEQVDALLGERNSQRSIARVTGVARMTIASRIKKSAGRQPPVAALAVEETPKEAVASAGTR